MLDDTLSTNSWMITLLSGLQTMHAPPTVPGLLLAAAGMKWMPFFVASLQSEFILSYCWDMEY